MTRAPLPIPEAPNPYQSLERTLIYDSPWIRLRQDRFRHRNGVEGIYPVCGFRRTACGVVALDGRDHVVLVGQWRYPLESYSWEIVEGGGLANESPFDCIRRELAEEAGLQAQVWEPLLYTNLSNSSTDEEAFLFLAHHLEPDPEGHRPDAEEELRVLRIPFTEALERVFTGEIRDGLTIVGLLALHARRTGQLPPLDPVLQERFFQRPDQHPSPGRARWDTLEP